MAKFPDLTTMAIHELQEIMEAAKAEMASKVSKRRAELLAELENLPGVEVEETPKPQRAKRTASAADGRAKPLPKYASKKDPSVTWTGRGATPRWMRAEMEDSGLTLEDFLIK